MEDWLSIIREEHKKGKNIHNNEFGNEADMYIVPFIVSALFFSPIVFLSLGLMTGNNDWMGSISFLLYFAFSIYGYYTILGFVNG